MRPVLTISGFSAYLTVILTCVMLMISPSAPAALLTKDSLLTDEQRELLTPNAKEQYDQAADYIDRGNYTVALRYMKDAYEAQDDHAELNFLLAQLAIYRGRQSFGSESIEYFDLAEEVLRANLRIKQLSFNNRQRTEKKLESVQDERDKVAERDNKRTEIGRAFIREQLVYRGVDLNKKSEEEEEKSSSSAASSSAVAPPPVTISPFAAPSAPFAPAPGNVNTDMK